MTTRAKTKTKRISNPGHKLELARKALSLTRLDIASRIGLDIRQVKQIEAWNIDHINLDNRQLRRVLKDYALLVDLRTREFTGLIDYDKPKTADQRPMIIISNRLISVVSITLVCFAIGFIGWRSYSASTAPTLVIFEPNDGLIVNDVSVKIRGQTSEQTQVYMNGSVVLINPDGTFEADLVLRPGENKLTLTAVNTYSKTTTINRTIFYTP
jgi:transcriptional regulator with XRE-family HTH domain